MKTPAFTQNLALAQPKGLKNALINGKNQAKQPLADGVQKTFAQMFAEVNRMQHAADAKMEEFTTSPEKDVHGTMIALQKADISLRLLMQVRSKITSAYQDITRMQL